MDVGLKDTQKKIGDGLNQLQDAVSDVLSKTDQKLGVTQKLKEVADHGIVKQTTSKMMGGVQKLGDLISKADQKYGVSAKVHEVSKKVGADKAIDQVDNLLGIQQRFDAFMSWQKGAEAEEEVLVGDSSSKPSSGDGIVPPRMRRVESDPGEDQKVMVDDKVRLVSTGWSSGFSLNLEHLKHEVSEPFQTAEGIEKFDSGELMALFDKIDITDADLGMWLQYNDAGRLFRNKSTARLRLNTVVTYCNGSKCTKTAALKLKFIALELVTKPDEYDPKGILLLLASHGNVCNVMKEVGIDMAYSSITSQNSELFKSQTLEERIYKLLYEFRIMLVEELYATFPGAVNNTHSIGMMRNFLAKDIGVLSVLDEHAGAWGLPNNWQTGLAEKYFKNHYNVEKITRWVFLAVNEEPRKIPYDLLMQWLEKNCPIEETYLFYSDTFNVDIGIFKTRYICWLLMALGVFDGPKIKWEVIQEAGEENVIAKEANDEVQAKISAEEEGSILSFSDRFDQVGKYSVNTFTNLFQGAQQVRNIFFAPNTMEEDIEIQLEESPPK